MFIRDILWIIGYYLLGFAANLLIPTAVAGYFQFLEPEAHPQPHTTLYFFETILFSLLLAGFCFYFGKKNIGTIYRREGIAAVVLIWILTPALSALPFLLSGTLANPHQAYFEMVSG
jgi:trk system potassium uptake protein TrkH